MPTTRATQHGGIKVLLPNYSGSVMEREIRSLQGLQTIFSNTVNIQIVSTSSLNSFVLRLHLDPATILFRSDTLDTRKTFFTRKHKKLSISQIETDTDGLPIHEIIIKICIINTNMQNINLDNFNGRSKQWITTNEFQNEYNTQRYLYSSMMSISGNPFCPDAFGIVTVDPPPHTNPRTNLNMFNYVPNIQQMLQVDGVLNLINQYLNRYSAMDFRLGIIIMESIPTSYAPIYDYSLVNNPRHNAETYKKLCEGIAAVNILSIYRGKLLHLDAHPGNWLCNPALPTLQQIKEIDFGRVYRIDNHTNRYHFIQDLKQNINIYITRRLPANISMKHGFMNQLFELMGITGQQYMQYTSEQNIDTKIRYIQDVFEQEINNIIQLFETEEYFSKPYMGMNQEERKMNILMIHRLVLISALIDSFYNCALYRIDQGQISHIYNNILNLDTINPSNLLSYGLRTNLDDYNLVNHDNAVELKKTYRSIYNTIYKYCEETNFPRIRNYQRFLEIHHTRGQNAWLKIKSIAREVAICSAKCSRAIGKAASHMPGSECLANVARHVHVGTLDLQNYLERKSTNAWRKVKSMVSSAHPYQPITVPERQQVSSPRINLYPHIEPLSYGGASRRKRHKHRNVRKHRHTRKY
jgi:hypothetical protein